MEHLWALQPSRKPGRSCTSPTSLRYDLCALDLQYVRSKVFQVHGVLTLLLLQTRSMDIFLTEHVQCLFASALDCLEMPLRKTLLHQEEPDAPYEQHDVEAATACKRAEQSQEHAQATHAPSGAAADLAELAASDDEEEHHKDVQNIAATLRNSATPSKTASIGGKAAAGLDLDTVEAMLEDLPDVFDHLAAAADDAGIGVDDGVRGGPAGTSKEEPAWQPDRYTVRAGSVLLLFALYHAQPGKHAFAIAVQQLGVGHTDCVEQYRSAAQVAHQPARGSQTHGS